MGVSSCDDHFHDIGSISASSDIFNGNSQWSYSLTQIIIDPGVKVNQDSSYLFEYLKNLQKIVDLANLDTTNVTDMSGIFAACFNLNHLILGLKALFSTNTELLNVPGTGTKISGTNRIVTSPYWWVATSGYQQGHKYTSDELMGLTGRDQVTTYYWDSTPAFTQTTKTKAVTRAIRIHQPNGYLKTELQTVDGSSSGYN